MESTTYTVYGVQQSLEEAGIIKVQTYILL